MLYAIVIIIKTGDSVQCFDILIVIYSYTV